MPSRLAVALVAWVLLGAAGCSSPPPPPPVGSVPLRLDDQSGKQLIREVQLGTEVRPVLAVGLLEHVFPLADAPPQPTLWVGLGIEPKGDAATWRAEVTLERDGAPPTVVHSETISAPGPWRDLRLPLDVPTPKGTRLVLRATLVTSEGDSPRRVLWGDPILLPAVPQPRPSVVLVSLDTLRADRVGKRADGRSRTPRLDAFAAEAVTYTQAYSPSLWTLPSHVSLLWGRHPNVLDRLHAADGLPPPEVLGPVASLAERFASAGYLAGGFTGGGWLSNAVGLGTWHTFGRGYDTYRFFWIPRSPGSTECNPKRFDGDTVFGWAEQWIARQGAQPYFLFVHTYEAHDRCPFFPPSEEHSLSWQYDAERQPKLDAYYDELIERTDALFGRLLDALAASGQAERTIVAVTSDHGEALFEHGAGGHGCGIRPWEEVSRVPLLVRPAKGGAATVTDPVSIVQVAPTLTALAGITGGAPFDEPPLPGLGVAGGTAPPAVVVQCEGGLAVRSGAHKLITDRTGKKPDELYDLAADPAERTNLAGKDTAAHAKLSGVAKQYWAATGATGAVPWRDVDPATRQQLKALGYVE